MSLPDIHEIYAAVEATWPPAASRRQGVWTLRNGAGGGKRVSAATAHGPVSIADIEEAEAEMRAGGQSPLFMIRDGDAELDASLATRGYAVLDPVTAYACEIGMLARPVPPMTALPVWPPLHIMAEVWRDGGIGPERLAVMERAEGPKTSVIGRAGDRAAGAGFVALSGRIAMLHALEVNQSFRRQGTSINILRRSATWAQDQGAEVFSVVVTSDNLPANNLYASLKLGIVGRYHYRGGHLAEG